MIISLLKPTWSQSAVASHHPNVWKFIEVLQREQGMTNVTLNRIAAGNVAPKPRRKYIAMSRRVCRLVRNYNNRDILGFLRGIAHNVAF